MVTMKKWQAFGVALAAGIMMAAAGNWHVVHGSDAPIRLVRKISWSLSELIVNTDQLGNMPMIFARSQYPLFLAVLERDGKARQEAREAIRAADDNPQAIAKIKSIDKGFSRATVIQLLGEPDSRVGPFRGQAGGLAIETLYYNGAGNVVVTGSEVSHVNVTAAK